VSHITEIKPQVTDLVALRCAAAVLGLPLLARSDGTNGPAGIIVHLHDGDVLFNLEEGQVYFNEWPRFDGPTDDLKQLLQRYGIEKARLECDSREMMHCVRRNPDGTMSIEIEIAVKRPWWIRLWRWIGSWRFMLSVTRK
jgi:hypothetical protein